MAGRIPHVYELDDDGRATDKVSKGCDWVVKGEGQAYRKWDGVPVRVQGEIDTQTVRDGAPIMVPNVLKAVGSMWTPIDAKTDLAHVEARDRRYVTPDGDYELVGPDVHGNPEGFDAHTLVPHTERKLLAAPVELEALREYLSKRAMEGIVWVHPDGRRMAQVTTNSLGLRGPNKEGNVVEIAWPRESDEERRARLRKQNDLDY